MNKRRSFAWSTTRTLGNYVCLLITYVLRCFESVKTISKLDSFLILLQVRSVYLCAWQLRMDSVVSRCGLFLASTWLSRETCLSVRALPGLAGDARTMVDKFMADNVND